MLCTLALLGALAWGVARISRTQPLVATPGAWPPTYQGVATIDGPPDGG